MRALLDMVHDRANGFLRCELGRSRHPNSAIATCSYFPLVKGVPSSARGTVTSFFQIHVVPVALCILNLYIADMGFHSNGLAK
ncbi:hypothetical protein BgiMline_002073 [Biomphalaria glabrata]|nr:hypothetical protein BgiBS90_024460 [Biomphalaria glabrata]